MTSRAISWIARQRRSVSIKSSLLEVVMCRRRRRRFETTTTTTTNVIIATRRSTESTRLPLPCILTSQSRCFSEEKATVDSSSALTMDRASASTTPIAPSSSAEATNTKFYIQHDDEVTSSSSSPMMFQSMEKSVSKQMDDIVRRRPLLEEPWQRTIAQQYHLRNRKRRRKGASTTTTTATAEPISSVVNSSSHGSSREEDQEEDESLHHRSQSDDTDHADVEPTLRDESSLFGADHDGRAAVDSRITGVDTTTDKNGKTIDEMDSMSLSELLMHDIEDNVFAPSGGITREVITNEPTDDSEPMSGSLMDLLDDDDNEEVAADSAPLPEDEESPGILSQDHHGLFHEGEQDVMALYDEDSADRSLLSLQQIVDQGVALLVVMKVKDWDALLINKNEEQHNEASDSPEDVVAEEDVLTNVEEEHLVDDFLVTDESSAAADTTLSKMTALDHAGIVLHDARTKKETLSASEYNLLLLELALFPTSTEDIFQNMLAIYGLMKEMSLVESHKSSAPDINTFLIMILALSGRGQAPSDAALICRDMIASGIDLNSTAISVAMKAFERENRLRDAEAFLHQLLSDENRDIAIPVKAFLSMMQIFRNENRQMEAVALIKSCIMEMGEFGHYGVSKLLQAAIHWPDRDRLGNRIDCSALLIAILEMLEPSDDPRMFDVKNNVSFVVWKRLIERISSERTPESNILIARAFKALQLTHMTFWPSPSMLKIGLRAAETLKDADLACDLVVRAREFDPHLGQSQSFQEVSSAGHDENHGIGDFVGGTEMAVTEEHGHHDFIQTGEEDSVVAESPQTLPSTKLDENGLDQLFEGESADGLGNTEPSVSVVLGSADPADPMPLSRPPPQAFMMAMEICVGTGNMKSVERLINCLDAPDDGTPVSVKNRIYLLALKGFAKTADADSALGVLERLRRGGFEPSEEAYGAVMHSLVASRRTDEAHDLFKSLERKETPGIARPGPTCFDASLLACLQTGDWDKALELHEKRTESSVPLTPSGFQGALIASFRRGGRGQALKYAEEMLGSNTELDQACCEVSMKILLRDLVPQSNISDTRGKLRAICEEDSELHSASIALLRSLRIAEAEQKRRVSNALTERELSRRRQKAWREALFHVVDLMKIANEQGKLVSSNTSTKSAKDSAVLPVAS